MEFEMIIITKQTIGSEDGINVKNFKPDTEPQRVERRLAKVFIATGCAEYPKAKIVAPSEAKIVAPKETK